MVSRPQTNDTRNRLLDAYLELAVVLAALGTVPLTVAQERGATGSTVALVDWAIWGVFLLDLVIGISRTSDRKGYVRSNWIDVAVVVLSFPALPALLKFARLARLARLTRLFRLVRLVAVATKGIRALRSALGQKGLVYVGSVALLLVFIGGGLLSIVEPQTVGGLWSGIWWAVVTITTVGYGDISPITTTGRVVGVVLMLVGIGLVATLAASIAAYFVGQDEDPRLEEINQRLARIEGLLEERS